MRWPSLIFQPMINSAFKSSFDSLLNEVLIVGLDLVAECGTCIIFIKKKLIPESYVRYLVVLYWTLVFLYFFFLGLQEDLACLCTFDTTHSNFSIFILLLFFVFQVLVVFFVSTYSTIENLLSNFWKILISFFNSYIINQQFYILF